MLGPLSNDIQTLLILGSSIVTFKLGVGSLKDSFTKEIKGTRFAYLENTLDPKNEFDQNKTIHYIENICRRRKLNIDDYIPQFRSHYDIK